MKLHSPNFDRQLRHGVREAVRAEPALRKARRLARKYPVRRSWGTPVFRLLAACIPPFVGWDVFRATGHIETAILIVNLWTFATTLYFAQWMLRIPHASRDLPALQLLPVADEIVFRWEWDKLVRFSLYSLVDLALAALMFGLLAHFSVAAWFVAAAAVPLTWALMLALAALGAARLPRFPYGMVVGNFFLAAFITVIGGKWFGPTLLVLADRLAPTFNLFEPTGWPFALLRPLLPGSDWIAVLLLLPLGVLLASFRSSLAILRTRYNYAAPSRPDFGPDEDEAESSVPTGPIVPAETDAPTIGVTAMAEGIESGQFMAQAEWNAGWFERKLWNWFTPREKNVAEFIFPKPLTITRPWKFIVRNFLITCLLGIPAAMANLSISVWIFGIGLFLAFSVALHQVLGVGVAFRVLLDGGVGIPLYAAYPVSFRELSRVICKCALIQMPLFIFITIGTSIIVSQSVGIPLDRGIRMGLKTGVVFYGVRYLSLVFTFSSGTDDTSRFRFRTFILLGFFAVFSVLCLLAGVIGVMIDAWWVAWPLCGLTLFLCYSFFRIYGWFYHAGRFDLMRLPRR